MKHWFLSSDGLRLEDNMWCLLWGRERRQVQMVEGCTCYHWTLNVFTLTPLFFFILSGSTETTHRTPAPVQLLKHRETHRKCDLLTYLLSFFSGGDFLSQPWKRISPPLMFVAVFCLLSLYKRPSVT